MVMEKPQTGAASPNAAIKPARETRRSTSASSAEESTIYIDGEFLPESEAKVSVFDHGLLYGDGIFEGIRFYQRPRLPIWKNIWIGSGIRPGRSASRFRCRMEEMTEALLETIRQNDLRDGYIRLIVTRGVGNLGLNPAQCKRPSVIIIATTIALYPEEMYRNGSHGGDLRDPAHRPGCAQSGGEIAELS